MNWYDYGARMYDPGLGRFTGIDPLTQKNNNQSGFVYAINNPIKYVDFMGLDTFLINSYGHITSHGEESATDVLIIGKGANGDKIKYYERGEKKGRMKNKSVEIEKGSFEKIEMNEGTVLQFGDNTGAAKTVFEFMADNTAVEYSLINYTGYSIGGNDISQQSSLMTSHTKMDVDGLITDNFGSRMSQNIALMQGNTIYSHYHSHPNLAGFNINPGPGDVPFAERIVKLANDTNIPFTIYRSGQYKTFFDKRDYVKHQ
jgi:hypothetical protein